MFRHVAIFGLRRGGTGLRRRMPTKLLVGALVEAHGMGSKLLAIHRHDVPMQFDVPPFFAR